MRIWIVSFLLAGAVLATAGAALLAWPQAGLSPDDQALGRVRLPGFAGRVAVLSVRAANGRPVSVVLRRGRIWPTRKLASGEPLTVTVTVRRPSWAGWLVGKTERRTFQVETPTSHLLGRWLQVKPGAPVRIGFSAPVTVVSIGRSSPAQLRRPRALVSVETGGRSAGAVWIAAAARSWERLPAPVRVSWFPARPYPQLLVAPAPGTQLRPGGQLTLTFSQPIAAVLGDRRPQLAPATPGRWRLLDAHTLAFQPGNLGFGLGADVRVQLPRAAHLAGRSGDALTRSLHWQVPPGSTLRLQQLLAELGYLPLDWQPAAATTVGSVRAELAAATTPPRGKFSWRYPNTPPELQTLWRVGQSDEITRAAVMMFEDTHGLAVDAIAGPRVWRALIHDAVNGTRRTDGYSYVYVHRNLPQSLNLWHNGQLILSSPGNTGVPAAPTQLGTFPVFEHIPVGTMSGTNPNGSHYNDPGIRWISYFHRGEAIHAFNRSSFGTPQSLGCVELPLASAAKVWPYTPIGTLVTIEN